MASQVSYSLTELSKAELREERKEILPKDIPSMLQNLGELLKLVPTLNRVSLTVLKILKFVSANVELFITQAKYGENDAMLSLKLMFKLSALPLTRQLTNISGNLWGKTLQVLYACLLFDLLLYKKLISGSDIHNYVNNMHFTSSNLALNMHVLNIVNSYLLKDTNEKKTKGNKPTESSWLPATTPLNCKEGTR
jgi:hypothetical protein